MNSIFNDLIGSIIVERELVNDIHGQGGGGTLAISNRTRGGVNSINDVILQDVAAGSNAKFYVTLLRGLCPGQLGQHPGRRPAAHQRPDQGDRLDGDQPYFVADAAYPYPKGTRFWNKNWFGALDIVDTHNADDQSGSLNVTRTTFGSGDTFGVQTRLQYSGDIMSAGGDEGGVAYSAEVHHDVDLFWGEVESWDPASQTLVYRDLAIGGPRQSLMRECRAGADSPRPTSWRPRSACGSPPRSRHTLSSRMESIMRTRLADSARCRPCTPRSCDYAHRSSPAWRRRR